MLKHKFIRKKKRKKNIYSLRLSTENLAKAQ